MVTSDEVSDALEREVTRFLVREARYMDEHRYDEWLALWAGDGLYWVPCNADDIDPLRQVSIIYDDYERIVQRIDRLKSGSVLAQDPPPRMRRVVSNVEIEAGANDELAVESNFVLVYARTSDQQLWAGRSLHALRRRPDGALRIARKKVLLINNDQEMPLLQFLI
jgi:3-phenylpropionate/cinnamic acid dioxygenase small subunit